MQYENPMNMDMEKFNEIMKDSNIYHLLELDFLIRIYPDFRLNDGFVTLKKEYPYFRAVKGDGNCFYRAVAFSYLRESDLSRFSNLFHPVKNICVKAPFTCSEEQLFKYLQRIYYQDLEPINRLHASARENALQQLFVKNQGFDTLMVMYLRSLNYHEIIENQQYYRSYVTSSDQVENIKTYGKESEGIEFHAMAKALNITIATQAVTNHGFTYVQYNQNANTGIEINIFFRPGHYDIIYPRNSIYLQNIKRIRKNSSSSLLDEIPETNFDSYPGPSYNYEPYSPQAYESFQMRQSQFEIPFNSGPSKPQNFNHRNNNNIIHFQSQNRKEPAFCGLNDLRERRKKQQQSAGTNIQQPKSSGTTKKSILNPKEISKQRQEISKDILSEPWNNPNTFQIDNKNKIQEAACLLLALVAIGYIMSLI